MVGSSVRLPPSNEVGRLRRVCHLRAGRMRGKAPPGAPLLLGHTGWHAPDSTDKHLLQALAQRRTIGCRSHYEPSD